MREIKWDWDKWFGDKSVQAMDWDAKAMHFHLIGLSAQEEPPGSLPDDMAAIRRQLGLLPGFDPQCQTPNACRCSDHLWRRVKPQIFAAWTLRDGRYYQKGTAEACQQQKARNDRALSGARAKHGLSSQQAPASPTLLRGFQVPSLLEVKSYCEERKNRVNPQAFISFYASKGWKVGSQPMKDWRQAVITWEQRDGKSAKPGKCTKPGHAGLDAHGNCWTCRTQPEAS